MKFILDTNVYIDAALSDVGWKRFEKHIIPLLPFIYLSSVVFFELGLSASEKKSELLLKSHIETLEKVGRLVTPTFDDWITSSQMVGNKELRSYLCDVLIGCSVRRIGAVLFTFDKKDFAPLSKQLGFEIKQPW